MVAVVFLLTGAVLALVKEPVATHAAEELTGLERLRQLLVRGNRHGLHGRNIVHRADARAWS